MLCFVLSSSPLLYLLSLLTTKNRIFGDDDVNLGRFIFPGAKLLFLDKLVEPFFGRLETEKYPEAVIAVLADELMGLKLLHYDAKVLCIGPGSDSAVSFWLKQSQIVHVNCLDEFSVIVFKKNMTESAPYVGKTQLPRDCQSVETNRPYIEFMEPLLEQKPVDFPKSVAYLPKFLDVSLKKRLVYIDMGAAEYLDAKLSPNWFLPLYPIDSKAFNVYFVDHNTSVMLSYVKKPGVTFVYHPDLAEGKTTDKNITPVEQLEPFPEDEGFDFLAWFEETTKYADFVVLKMNTSQVEMKFLSVLMETGAICSVDEFFLRCSNHKPDCINILQTLRTRGVFVHQWWED